MVTPVAQLQSSLHSGRERLLEAIRGLNEEQFRATPAGESWSIATYLAHLLRIERVYAERARAAVAEDEPHIPSTRALNDGDPGLAQHLAVPQVIHGLLNARRELDAVLASCDDQQLQRAVHHETLGRMTLEAIALKMAAHEAEHTADIARLVKLAPASARVIIPLATRS